jgi:hypothetical protein
MDNSGQVVGDYGDATGAHGFLLEHGRFTSIDVPGAGLTEAFGVGPNGTIVGRYGPDIFSLHGFALRQGEFTTIDVPGATRSEVFDVNSSGVMVGSYLDTPPTTIRGFRRTP